MKTLTTDEYFIKSATFLGWGGRSAVLDNERIKLIDKFVIGKKVLDIGCGYGLYVDYLKSKGYLCTGVDMVDQFLEIAKKAKLGNFVKASAENLPFKDSDFDTVLLFDILEHGDDLKFLKEARRVAKKRILIIVPRQVDAILADSGVVFRHFLDKSHLREYKWQDLENLAKKVGLKLTYKEAVHPLYNETIFLALFGGSLFIKKLIRKLVFFLLPKKRYPTEIFAVFEKYTS